ncbi:MAG: C_GCAxxG_C_C family protein [Chloroflexi bacterium]|nr:C_GCAxxG_C_C family protein [Chloroflexota bacterium]
MTNPTDRAVSAFQDGFACSQAVLSAFASDLDLPTDLALKLAAPFGGGIARRGEMCGAVSGALLVIGLTTGNVAAQDQEAKDRTYALVREFIVRFQARHSTITCRELLDCDISVPAELQRARDAQLFANVCPKLVRSAAEIVGELTDGTVR